MSVKGVAGEGGQGRGQRQGMGVVDGGAWEQQAGALGSATLESGWTERGGGRAARALCVDVCVRGGVGVKTGSEVLALGVGGGWTRGRGGEVLRVGGW